MSDTTFWNIIYKVTQSDLKKKEDVLTLLVHFLLIKTGHKCVGLGEDKTIKTNESESEVLPTGWNSSCNYSLRYLKDGVLYILKGISVDDTIVYNLLRVDNLAVTNVAFNVNETVQCLKGSLEALFKNKSSEVINKICTELLNAGSNKEVTTQTLPSPATTPVQQKQTGTSPTPPQAPIQVPPVPPVHPDPFRTDPQFDPLRVGRADLDPFGRGGGMIFDPFGQRGSGSDPGFGIPGGLPRGAIPPGARFDPFGPPGVSQPRPRPPPPPDADSFDSWYM